jgi:hypothetical protein
MSVIIFWLGNVFADATLTNNEGLTVSEGNSDTITETLLLAEDIAAPGAILTYTIITAPVNGSLMRDGVTLMSSDTFTQTDINNSVISYTHDNSETSSDSFGFTVETSNTVQITATFPITVSPIFDETPNVADQTFDVDENSVTGTPVDTIIATDLDVADALTYTIIGGNFGSPFAVASTTGDITVDSVAPLDFETNQLLTFTVQVEDLGALIDTAVITVNLNDVNEAPTLADTTLPDLPEDSPATTLVGTVTATDPDAGEAFTYSITGGNPGPSFVIGSSSGDIFVANTANLDFETTPTYTLTVEVTDSGLLVDTADIVINLTNVNEPPTLNDTTFSSTNENSPNGTAVGTLVGNDPDANETLTYSITASDPTTAFAIGSSSGTITVSNSSLLDFETTPTFTLTVEVEDSGSLVDTAEIVINLQDTNELPTVNDNTFNLDENSVNTTPVGTVSGSDPDAADVSNLSFGILSGNTGGAFAIANDGSNNGAITVANSNQLDFETNQSFTLGIIVTDTGGLNNTANVTININNLFDEAPTASDATFFVAEGSANGVVVGTVSATDPELASGDALTYAITGGNTGSVFAINSSNGQITVPDVSKLDSNSMPIFNLTVTVTDLGNNVDTAIITINVSPLPITYLYLPILLNKYPPIEPNNNCSQSYGIGMGVDYEFTADDTEDWYAITLSNSGNLTIVLSSFEPAQGQLIIYSGSCSGLTFLQSNGTATTTKTINLGTQPAGTYYIRVFSAPITNTTYNLRVN